MKGLLEMLGLKRKPVVRQIILSDTDLVKLDGARDKIAVFRDGHLYRVKENFSEIDSSNPRVTLKYLGYTKKSNLIEFQTYGTLKSSN